MPFSLRRSILSVYRYFRDPRRRKKSAFFRWMGDRMFNRGLWSPRRQTFAIGVGVGLFVAMYLVPGQMVLAAILAVLLRGNVPVAMAFTWVSSPVTWAPIFALEKSLGAKVLNALGGLSAPEITELLAEEAEVEPEGFAALWQSTQEMLIGAGILSVALGLLGYVVAWSIWRLVADMLVQPAR